MQGEIPLTEAVINTLAAEKLRSSETPLESAEVQVRPEGEFFVRVRLRRSFVPPVIVGLRVEQQPDLPRSAVVGFRWWLPGMGALATLAAPVLAFFKAGPPWMKVEGHHLFLDLAHLLRDQGADEILGHLKSIRIGSREKAVVVQFEARIE